MTSRQIIFASRPKGLPGKDNFALEEYDLTTYFGLIHIGKPKAGETLVFSGAAGAVGLVVG